MDNISIALLSTLIGVIIGIATFSRNRDKDIKKAAKEDAETKAKLDYISRGVDDIKLDNKQRDREFSKMNDRITIVEQSVKSAHRRLDVLEEDWYEKYIYEYIN